MNAILKLPKALIEPEVIRIPFIGSSFFWNYFYRRINFR
jgi:hypothetical protein